MNLLNEQIKDFVEQKMNYLHSFEESWKNRTDKVGGIDDIRSLEEKGLVDFALQLREVTGGIKIFRALGDALKKKEGYDDVRDALQTMNDYYWADYQMIVRDLQGIRKQFGVDE